MFSSLFKIYVIVWSGKKKKITIWFIKDLDFSTIQMDLHSVNSTQQYKNTSSHNAHLFSFYFYFLFFWYCKGNNLPCKWLSHIHSPTTHWMHWVVDNSILHCLNSHFPLDLKIKGTITFRKCGLCISFLLWLLFIKLFCSFLNCI